MGASVLVSSRICMGVGVWMVVFVDRVRVG